MRGGLPASPKKLRLPQGKRFPKTPQVLKGRFSGYYWGMQVATGTVVNGKIVAEGISLTEGAVVAVVTRDADETFSLTETQESELGCHG